MSTATATRTSIACPGCGAVYAGALPACLICGRSLEGTPPPAPPSTPSVRAPRRKGVIRIISLVSMVLGLASSGVGVVRAMRSNSPAPRGVPAASAPAKSSPVAVVSSPSPSSAPVAAVSTCANDVFGYSLSYPAAWVASSLTPEQGCSAFDLRPIPRSELLKASRAGRPPRAAIRIYPYGASYSRAVVAIHNRSDVNANDTIDMAVGNTSGERILAIVRPTSGARTKLFLYLLDLRGKAFVAEAYQPYSTDFAETMRVLDRMMRSLRVQ
jgi:hypothetical protein